MEGGVIGGEGIVSDGGGRTTGGGTTGGAGEMTSDSGMLMEPLVTVPVRVMGTRYSVLQN